MFHNSLSRFGFLAGTTEEVRQRQDGFGMRTRIVSMEEDAFGLCNVTATFQRLMAQAQRRSMAI